MGRWSYSSDRTFNKSEYSIVLKMRDRKENFKNTKKFINFKVLCGIKLINYLKNLIQKSHILTILEDVIDYAAKENNFNDINSKLSNECNGYIVFGTERPFIELFRDNRSRQHYMKKIIKSDYGY